MRARNRQLLVVLIGASFGAVGWGAVLPFLYADIANARGLGAAAAALTFTAFAFGALLASPVAGRLADRCRPVTVATAARLAMVVMIIWLMVAPSPGELWVAALGYGAALALLQPSVSVLVLGLTPPERRRDAFAWQFIGQNLGLAIGGVVGGHLIDLATPTGARPAYLFAAAGSLVSAVLVAAARVRSDRPARGEAPAPADPAEAADAVGFRAVLQAPGVRWLLAVTAVLTLACYAQFDSGLPSYALTVLDIDPGTLGTAVAVNAVLVAALTAPVVRLTRTVAPGLLLAACASIWVVVWLVLGVPLLHHAAAAAFVVMGYALFSLGETMLAPVLSPLAATLAPSGAVGRTLAAMNGAQTAATAVGPGLSGALLGLGLPAGFIALQVLCCAVAILGARRLNLAASHREDVALAA